MDPTQIINQAYDISKESYYKIMASLQQKLNDKKNENFIESFDFSRSGKVIHAHIYYLEWLYGAVYRKHSEHFFLLYDFDVNDHSLKQEHKDALSEFFEIIYTDQLVKNSKLYPREFETYLNPFLVNIKKSKKEANVSKPQWAPESNVSREDIIRGRLIELIKQGDNNPRWWENNSVAFANTTHDFNSTQDGNNANYPPFQIQELLYWRNSPDLTKYFSRFIGRASETGSNNINDPLSLKRAKSVTDYLNEQIENLKDYLDDTNLQLVEDGIGSSDPIILDANTLEVAENRSVQFSFYQQHDYIHLDSPKELKKKYKSAMEEVNEKIKHNIDLLEVAVDSGSPNSINLADLIRGGGNDSLESIVDSYDASFAFGNAAVDFAKTFNGDFANLEQDYSLPNHPQGMNLFGQQIDSPEGADFVTLPMTQIISKGSRTTSDFKLPLSPESRIRNANQIFIKMRNVMTDIEGHVPDLTDEFVEYYKHWTKNPVASHSFLFKQYDKETFFNLMAANEWNFTIDFSNEKEVYKEKLFNNPLSNHIATFVVDVFNSNFIFEDGVIYEGIDGVFEHQISEGDIDRFYWYNSDVSSYQFQMKKLIAKNVVKITALCFALADIDDSAIVNNTVKKVELISFQTLSSISSFFSRQSMIPVLTIKWFPKFGGDSDFTILDF